MFNVKAFKNLVAGGIAAAAISTVPTPALASHDCPSSAYRYQTVTVYESVQVPYTVAITKYDHCGRAYTVKTTRFKTIRRPITHKVVRRY